MYQSRPLRHINWSLYGILDRGFVQESSLTRVAEELIAGGAGVLQLRDKLSSSRQFFANALKVQKVTQKHQVPLIINDRVDIAAAVKADGVHLGQNDLPVRAARAILRQEATIGVSVHDPEEFAKAEKDRPDYFGVGTIYPTSTKSSYKSKGPFLVKLLRTNTDLPLIAIGGITLENLAPVIENGADGVAVISSLLTAQDVRSRATDFLREVNRAKQNTRYHVKKEAA